MSASTILTETKEKQGKHHSKQVVSKSVLQTTGSPGSSLGLVHNVVKAGGVRDCTVPPYSS